MLKKLHPRWLVFLVILGLTSLQLHAQNFRLKNQMLPTDARALATKALPAVLQWIEPEDLSLYGFSATDDFSKIVVGRPFLLSSVNEIQVSNELQRKSGIESSSMMLPLILDGKVRCFIYISNEAGGWKAVGIGGNGYIKNHEKLFSTADDNLSVIVAAHNLNEEFIIESNQEGTIYRPLFHANAAVSKKSYGLAEVISLENAAPKQIEH